MNELIPVKTNDNQEPIVSGRDLHRFLEVSTKYPDWIKRMMEYGFTEGTDFITMSQQSTGGRPSADHTIKLYMAIDVCRKHRRNKKAAELYKYLRKYANGKEMVYIEPTRLELSFKSVLSDMLNEFGFEFKSQYSVQGFRIDFYFEKQKLAVEYDENFHSGRTRQICDAKREQIIKQELGCSIVRVSYLNSDVTNASKILSKLLGLEGKA